MHTIRLLIGKLEILLEVDEMKVTLNITDLIKLLKCFNVRWRFK